MVKRGKSRPKIRLSLQITAAIFLALVLIFQIRLDQGQVQAAQSSELLWGISQKCDFAIVAPENSIDGRVVGFDGKTASCSWGNPANDSTRIHKPGEFSWVYTDFEDTSFETIKRVKVTLGWLFSEWVDEVIKLQISFNDGSQWYTLKTFDQRHPPPARLTYQTINVNLRDITQAMFNKVQIRILAERNINKLAGATGLTIHLDEVNFELIGSRPLTKTPTPEPTSPISPSPQVTETPSTTTEAGLAERLISPTPMNAARSTVEAPQFPQTLRGPPLPTPTAPVPAPTSVPLAGDPHVNHPLLDDKCAACHRSHTGQGGDLRDQWPEEAVCFSCHINGGPGVNIEPAFTNYANSLTRIFIHDIFSTSSVHQYKESSPGALGGGNRHIECEDCHNPHDATRGSAFAPMLQLEMKNSSGVDPIWNSPGSPGSYTWLPQAAREYQVCFKCHSSFTSLPAYVPDGWNGINFVANGLKKLTSSDSLQINDSRDMAREFNPYQESFHPVVTLGRNQNIPPGTFVNGWSQSSMMYCTDCHDNANAGSQGSGPHGSPLLHILTGQANYSTVVLNGSPRVTSQELCFRCHDYQAYVLEDNGSNFNFHKKHLDNEWGTTCYTCHDSHGSEQAHLINFDASAMTFLNGTDSQSAWYYNQSTGRAGCFLSCHGKSHNPIEYTP